jgi:1-acyl-sn-glycerol-3-phosphate acyltransferase
MKTLREMQYRPGGLLRPRSSYIYGPAGERRRDGAAPSARGAVNAHRIGIPLMHSLWRVRIHGAANVPSHGAVILAGNHTAFLDGPLIVGVAPRPVHFLVKQEMFVGPLGPILHGLGQIPVDRGRPDRAAIQSALATLRADGVLGVFPEGTRTTGDFESVHNGLAYFALSSGAPVVPVACLGTSMNGKTVGALPPPRATLDLVFGTPLSLEELTEGTEGLGRRQTIAAVSEQLRVRLAAHVQKSRRLTGRDD